jgi:hypothetical protein
LKGHLQIEWLGNFSEMLSGSHSFCQKMSFEFLGTGEQESVPPIPPEHAKGFSEELRSYGQ